MMIPEVPGKVQSLMRTKRVSRSITEMQKEARVGMTNRTYHFTIGDALPSTAIVRAITHVKGVDARELEPLGARVDLTALDDLIERSENVSLSISVEGLEISMDESGDIEIVEPEKSLHEELDDAPTTLFLEPTKDRETCVELLSPAPYEQLNVLGVTFTPSPDEWIASWNSNAGESPAEATIVDVGETTRSATSSAVVAEGPTAFSIMPISNPRDIAHLGGAITNRMAKWADNENETVVCFHSITDLLEHVDEEHVFNFLTMITSHLRHQEAVAHFHMDPTEHDDKTIYLMDQVFDAIVEVDEVGGRTVTT